MATTNTSSPPLADRNVLSAVGILGAAVCAVSVVFVTRSVPPGEALGRGITEALVIALPIAAGLYALRVPHNARFGFALIAAGFAWSLTALGQAEESLPYSIGRLAAWFVFPSLIYLMLAFPDGRVRGRSERILLRSLTLLLWLFYIASALFVEAYPEHTPWATCSDDCPPNAFLVLDHQPAVMDQVVQPVRELLAILLFTGVIVVMAGRWRRATPLLRRTTLPVIVLSAGSVALLAAFFVARRAAPDGDAVEVLGLLWGLCIAAIAAAFLAGLVRRRLLIGEVLAQLTARISREVNVAHLRDALADALSDPTLELLVPDGPVRWRDSCGHLGALPHEQDGRALTVIADERGASAVALVHDPALRADGELLEAVSALVLGTVRHYGVTNKLARALSQLDQSRRRIAEAAVLERARIERDLHDGAQQRLITLRIRLSLAEELLHTDPHAGAVAIHELGDEAEHALEELRSLAHGVYPAILHDRGLAEALRSLALSSPMSIHLQLHTLERLPMPIETAVYFTCLEAVQNAIKHARCASSVWIVAGQGEALTFEIRDDGPGFTPLGKCGEGTGLRNMRDRLEAVGGQLVIDSSPGAGTRVIGTIPLVG